MTDYSIKTEMEHERIAEEADCCLSFSVHPIARYLAEECGKEADTKEETR